MLYISINGFDRQTDRKREGHKDVTWTYAERAGDIQMIENRGPSAIILSSQL